MSTGHRIAYTTATIIVITTTLTLAGTVIIAGITPGRIVPGRYGTARGGPGGTVLGSSRTRRTSGRTAIVHGVRGLVRTGGTGAQRCGILGSDILTVANTDIARGITARISIFRIRIPRRTRRTRRPRIIISRLRRHSLYGLGTISTIRRTTRLNCTITRSRTVRIGNITARILGTRIPFRHRRTVRRHTAIYLGPGPRT